MRPTRILSLLLLCAILTAFLASCGGKDDAGASASGDGTENGVQLLSFSQTQSVEEMKKLDGKTVTIIGYMSTLSPISGAFMYLMNLPYQSCPFCIPNTTELSNTMAVYAKNGKSFAFTDRAIRVTGTMEFGDYEDEYGYTYGYRIKDAEYEILDTSDMGEKLQLWQQLASTEVISEIYAMFEYVRFLSFWTEYTAQFGENADSKDYLYPNDALKLVETEGRQYHYGFEEGYFDGIIETVREIDEAAFSDLIAIVEDAKALANDAYTELKSGNCTKVTEYSGAFGDGRAQYKLNNGEALQARYKKLFYTDFSDWMAGWEL